MPRDVLQLVHVDENDLGQQLVADPRVDRLILTGAYETAELFRSFRPDLPLLAETSGKNAMIVTPTADLDLAVKDVVALGLRPRRAEVLGGVAGDPGRLGRDLAAASASSWSTPSARCTVGWPSEAGTQMGPVIEPAAGKLLHALTTLAGR